MKKKGLSKLIFLRSEGEGDQESSRNRQWRMFWAHWRKQRRWHKTDRCIALQWETLRSQGSGNDDHDQYWQLNHSFLFFFFRRCCQDNTLWEQPYVCQWKADYRIYSVTIRWMLTTTDNIYYMVHISLKTFELSVVVVSRISVRYVKYIWNIAHAVVFLWPNQTVMHSKVGRCLKWQFLI